MARHRLGGPKRYTKCNTEEKGARKKCAHHLEKKFAAALRAAPHKHKKPYNKKINR